MQIQILKNTENEISFVIRGINPAIANYIRRSMVAEIPILAIDEVNFIKNDSVLYDEIIAHRLGLTPLKTDLKSYELTEECTCKGAGCAKCTLNFTLKAKGPGMVYASDLKSQDPKISSVYEKMPIVLLVKNQELELEATARLGLGKNHAKFIPGVIYYRSAISGKGKSVSELDFKDTAEYELDSETDFVFTIESFGQLTAREIFEVGLKRFNEKLDEFEKFLKKI
ncbi:DNA-directed RNA polymerase subunit D [Candidatus Woesearchaeota archaeon]|nr:DNA-directed RNA polymerase subunit D [Candidatus Woesearchaeota archaeon]